MKKSEKELVCSRIGVPTEWFDDINDILIANGFDNWHLRENHAIIDILEYVKSLLSNENKTSLELLKDMHAAIERYTRKSGKLVKYTIVGR